MGKGKVNVKNLINSAQNNFNCQNKSFTFNGVNINTLQCIIGLLCLAVLPFPLVQKEKIGALCLAGPAFLHSFFYFRISEL